MTLYIIVMYFYLAFLDTSIKADMTTDSPLNIQADVPLVNVIQGIRRGNLEQLANNEANPYSVGILSNAVAQVINLPVPDAANRFRTPCRTGKNCAIPLKRLVVPRVAQLENMIMGIMRELANLPTGARVPEKNTKTDPTKLLMDGMYKEPLCTDTVEACLKEDKRKKRMLKKLFFKRYNGQRLSLIGYGGRQLWGGYGNLFYKR